MDHKTRNKLNRDLESIRTEIENICEQAEDSIDGWLDEFDFDHLQYMKTCCRDADSEIVGMINALDDIFNTEQDLIMQQHKKDEKDQEKDD